MFIGVSAEAGRSPVQDLYWLQAAKLGHFFQTYYYQRQKYDKNADYVPVNG
jgi:hypothetical protein